jgi:tetratricopeptide (TPR) repeat protein
MKIAYPICLLFLSLSYQTQGQDNSEVFDSPEKRSLKADEYYELGNDQMYQEAYEAAIASFDEAINLSPRTSAYYMQRAQAKELASKKVAALIDYEIVIRLDPENPNAYFKRGLLYHNQKKYKQAIADFSHLLTLDHYEDTKAIIFKGIETNKGGDATFSSLETMDKMQGDIYNARASSYMVMNDLKNAMEDFDSAVSINANSANFLVNRGLLHLQNKDSVEAESDFRKALELDDTHHVALYNLSLIANKTEKRKINNQIFSQGQYAQAYSRRGYDKYMSGAHKSALNDYDSALVLRPNHGEDLMNRGLAKLKLNQTLGALKDFQTSINKDRNLIRNYVHLGNTYQAIKDYQQAIGYYQLYLTLNGDDPSVFYNKGIAELNYNQNEEACKSLKYALALGEEKARKVIGSVCN